MKERVWDAGNELSLLVGTCPIDPRLFVLGVLHIMGRIAFKVLDGSIPN